MSETKTNPISQPAATGAEAEASWKRFDEALAKIRANIPPEITEEELDRDIEAALREVRGQCPARGD